MTTALYNQELLDDPETPTFNEMLSSDCDLLEYVLNGDWEPKKLRDPAILELAFTVDPADFELTRVPTVAGIEEDIDAGRVPLVEPVSRHRSEKDPEPEPEPEPEKEVAFAEMKNRDN